MMGRQSGLGRGLGALIPQRPSNPSQTNYSLQPSPVSPAQIVIEDDGDDVSGSVLLSIAVDVIDPNPHQPRTHFDHADLEDLVGSIKEHGILQPLTVTAKTGGRYELIAGERRLRAAKIAGLESVPAVVRIATERQKMELAIIENVQRADLNPMEEARAYLRLQDEFGLTQDEIGQRIGKSRPQVGNTMRLVQLPEEIQHALVEKKISASNARTLLSLPTEQERISLFRQMLDGNFTVRQTEARVPHHPRRRSIAADPNLTELEAELQAALGVRVSIRKDARGEGEVRIKFFNEEDLRGIVVNITKSGSLS